MNQKSSLKLLLLFWVASLSSAATCFAQSWSGLRGDDGRGVVATEGVLSKTSDARFLVRWKIAIGSGYSSPAVSRGNVVVMYCDDTHDLVGCFDTETGEQRWQVEIGDKYVGQNGSFDGPLSTPLILDGKVFALSPRGRFLAIELASGKTIWTRELTEEEQAPEPLYGFTTSPIAAEGNVILQIGAKDKSVAAFNPDTGATEWSVGNDAINSQTPILAEVAGKPVVLAAGGKSLLGIDPLSGQKLLEYEHQGGNGSAMVPVEMGGGRFVLTLDDRFSKAIQIRELDGALHASEAWQAPSIKNTYNVPALANGHLFAYSTRILTCVDPATGKAIWKNRKPGDGFLIVVDGHLIVATKKGTLHLAVASPSKYSELDQLKLFEDLVWSIPAFSSNAVYCRSLGELARVDLVAKAEIVANAEAESKSTSASELERNPEIAARGAAPVVSGLVSPKLKQLSLAIEKASAKEKATLVQRFIADNSPMPLVEGDHATFVYPSKSEDVAVASDIFGARQERKMERLAGTDLFYLTTTLPPRQRVNYCFLVNYQPQLDPNNKERTVTSTVYAGEMEFAVRLSEEPPLQMSWFGMSEWSAPDFTKAVPGAELAGTISQLEIDLESERSAETKSDKGSGQLKLEVYLPPRYSARPESRLPVLYVFGGPQARRNGRMVEYCDRFLQSKAGSEISAIVVFLNERDPAFSQAFPNKIVRAVDSKFRTIASRNGRLLVGGGFSGTGAMMALLQHPKLFGGFSIQSPLVFDAARDAAIQNLSGMELPAFVRIEWGRYDMFNPHENWDVRTMCRQIVAGIQGNKNLTVVGDEVFDTTDWMSWRNRYDRLFQLARQMSQSGTSPKQ